MTLGVLGRWLVRKRNEMDASVRPAVNSFVMHTGPSKLWPACRTVCPLDWMG